MLRPLVLLALVSWGCSEKKEPPRPEIPREYTPSGHMENIVRYLAKTGAGKEWVFYLQANRPLPDTLRRYPVYAFIDKKADASLLIVGKVRYAARGKPLVTMERLKGILDELHVVRLGAASRTHLLLSKTHYRKEGTVYSRTTFWDLHGGKLKVLWSIGSSYDPDYRETYNPPEFHYWDNNDDGIREIILTNSWPDKKKPPRWKARWAVFRWNPDARVIVPVRGLLLSKYKDQNPLWISFAAVEAGTLNKERQARLLMRTHAICDSTSAMLSKLLFKKWKISGPPKFLELQDHFARVSMDLKGDKVPYRMVFELHGQRDVEIERWLICRISLFKKKS